MTRSIALAFATVLMTSGASFAFDWTAPDADQPNLPVVSGEASMQAPAATFGITAPREQMNIYGPDQDATIDGQPDFESD